MPDNGSFSGDPKTEWLVDPGGADRDMQLLEDFSYTDPAGKRWPAPKGSVINGASIPRPLWATVGSPYTDDYRRASVVHDVACNTPRVARKDADVMFYYACLAGGCDFVQARILYAGVRIGAWTASSLPPEALSRERLLFRRRGAPPVLEEQFLQGKLSDITREMESLPDDASIDQFDKAIAKHLNI